MKMVRLLSLAALFVALSSLAVAQPSAPVMNPAAAFSSAPNFGPGAAWENDPRVEQRVNSLLQRMTLEEKIGQLVQYSYGTPTGPGTGRADYKEMVARGQIGSLLNATGARETNEFQRIAMERSRLKIPLIFGLDVIHGYRTIFPVPLALAATWNPQIVERASRLAAQEATAAG